ncbi:MAG TPA: hypothetical protein VGC13_24400 [Longimicrobium sp.]|jgi:hypothetical protein|uniref:hypothetical protein n=1 Tax=Longimicrobium sp. TaxID=2029185 RepID=UPI002ED954A5
MRRRPKRTIRKPTRWSPDEWRAVEAAARARHIPALRFVREATLATAQSGDPTAAPPRRRLVRDELVHQLARVLNNLRQLERVADEDGAAAVAALAAASAHLTEQAIKAAPGRAREAAAVITPIITAGRVLNELVHAGHADEALPSTREIVAALAAVDEAVQRVFAL